MSILLQRTARGLLSRVRRGIYPVSRHPRPLRPMSPISTLSPSSASTPSHVWRLRRPPHPSSPSPCLGRRRLLASVALVSVSQPPPHAVFAPTPRALRLVCSTSAAHTAGVESPVFSATSWRARLVTTMIILRRLPRTTYRSRVTVRRALRRAPTGPPTANERSIFFLERRRR